MIKVIIWDFDGVLIESNKIRELGFKKVLSNYSNDFVEQLLNYHRENGGLSRYVKFRYFYDKILGEEISDTKVKAMASQFSEIMKHLLVNPSLLIQETILFVKNNFNNYKMFIVSGSDQNELRYLCKEFEISKYFKGIYGSPVAKNENVSDLLLKYSFDKKECLLIGDSINDYDAAIKNSINFLAFNNSKIANLSTVDFKIN